MDILNQLNQQLVSFLKCMLPAIDSDWWKSLVLEKLTFQQKSYAQSLPPNSLEQLDLSALLRVTDQNWYDISTHGDFGKEVRNWLKEAQSIRNRWAHAPAGGLRDDDHYRDLDTIERLTRALGADNNTIDKISETKKIIARKLAGVEHSIQSLNRHNAKEQTFMPGDMVRLKADPTKTGVVTAQIPSDPENRYQVFHQGNSSSIYYESQLELTSNVEERADVTRDDLFAALTAMQLKHPSTRYLYSLYASRINFVPYQFRPVLKLIQADRPRILIADEVGVGKTIEAGLIIKELQARRDLKSVLVICPKPLVAERKWLDEMKRFEESFEHLDGATLRYCIDETNLNGYWPQRLSHAILPYSLLDETLMMGDKKGRKKQIGILDLDTPPTFDLVIVDEAHAIRNTDTWAYRAARYFCDNAEAVVLLSATPIQMSNNDLYTLLNLLRPDVITSRQDFDHMGEPNCHINAAIEIARGAKADWKSLARVNFEKALATHWGSAVLTLEPKVQQVYDILTDDDESSEIRLMLIRDLESLYTFAPFINRTRRRDIGNFTTRKPETVTVEFTTEQEALHNDLLDLLARILQYRHGDINLKFMLSTVRRQIASCVFGLAPLLENLLEKHLSKMQLGELGIDNKIEQFSDYFIDFRSDVDSVVRQAKALNGTDPKLNAFLKVIRDKQRLPNNKLLVFSSFRHTLNYLIEKLTSESLRVGLIHGDIPDYERRELRNRFKLPREQPTALDVLLSSEVGCEGLDYQFCDALVNYDIPWNPMKVEQRIGRIDRYGQKSETAVIYNFITPGTIDADIYDRCLMRIGVFRQALGGSEEILGRLTREISEIADSFNLTTEERADRFQQLADNEIRDIQEQDKLEQQQSKLFGVIQAQADEEMINQTSSFWLKDAMLINLISQYLQALGASSLPITLKQKKIITIKLNQNIRDKLLSECKGIKCSGEAAQTWSRWLKGNEPNLTLTFDQETASDRQDLMFVTPIHPLSQQAAKHTEPKNILACNLKAECNALPKGRYPYAIYKWCKLGIKEDFTFQPICKDKELTNKLLKILEIAKSLDSIVEPMSSNEEQSLEQDHHMLWTNSRAAHIEQVEQHAQSRLASLKTTHTARIAVLEEQRDNVVDPRIRRMRDAQIDSATRDYLQHANLLENASKQADILAEPIAFGVLVIDNVV